LVKRAWRHLYELTPASIIESRRLAEQEKHLCRSTPVQRGLA